MKKNRFRLITSLLALLGLIAVLTSQYHQATRLRAENVALRNQIREDENARQVALPPVNEPTDTMQWSQQDVNELMRLRALATRMQEVEQENVRLKSELDPPQKPAPPSPEADDVADQDTPEWQTVQGAMVFTKGLGLGLLGYAHEHGGQMPPDILVALETMDPGHFDRVHVSGMPAGTPFETVGDVEFEMVFYGHLDDLGERSPSTVVMARQAEPVQLSNGRWARACVLGDGSSRVLVADTLEGLASEEAPLTFTETP